MGTGPLVVTYPLTGRSRAIVEEELGETAEAIYLVDLTPAARAHALGRAEAVLSHDTSKELRPDEIPLIRNARLLHYVALAIGDQDRSLRCSETHPRSSPANTTPAVRPSSSPNLTAKWMNLAPMVRVVTDPDAAHDFPRQRFSDPAR